MSEQNTNAVHTTNANNWTRISAHYYINTYDGLCVRSHHIAIGSSELSWASKVTVSLPTLVHWTIPSATNTVALIQSTLSLDYCVWIKVSNNLWSQFHAQSHATPKVFSVSDFRHSYQKKKSLALAVRIRNSDFGDSGIVQKSNKMNDIRRQHTKHSQKKWQQKQLNEKGSDKTILFEWKQKTTTTTKSGEFVRFFFSRCLSIRLATRKNCLSILNFLNFHSFQLNSSE